jgi:hypothetical protein
MEPSVPLSTSSQRASASKSGRIVGGPAVLPAMGWPHAHPGELGVQLALGSYPLTTRLGGWASRIRRSIVAAATAHSWRCPWQGIATGTRLAIRRHPATARTGQYSRFSPAAIRGQSLDGFWMKTPSSRPNARSTCRAAEIQPGSDARRPCSGGKAPAEMPTTLRASSPCLVYNVSQGVHR